MEAANSAIFLEISFLVLLFVELVDPSPPPPLPAFFFLSPPPNSFLKKDAIVFFFFRELATAEISGVAGIELLVLEFEDEEEEEEEEVAAAGDAARVGDPAVFAAAGESFLKSSRSSSSLSRFARMSAAAVILL